ncbi:uncharacterized protein EDB91DRAFT_1239786 [Suillus paluster]|uniref:uncharacterized protein n=1 Tax=Suillus paluster TaxID=48578 RepID=UPI001B861034|nr:uncharacterized protein EDB91DRAFT_1239786 [Suillus paluster]KAG1725566.1 hypothetical protein EDB91DRAFT_1239786 [Suillus paluster]
MYSPDSSVFDLPLQSDNSTRTIQGTWDGHDPTLITNGHVHFQNQVPEARHSKPSFLVISGGSGGNSVCAAFENACYVLPVSDDGGSSSEIIRVLGGPSIGDIRSRLVRLIPLAPPGSPLDAVRTLLSYRLPLNVSESEARAEWRSIIEGQSPLWSGIPNDRKEVIRGFLVYFENEVLKRAHKHFSFLNGSIGNYFLAGAQGFFRSLPSAIFLFSTITNSQANILPVIVTNHITTIAAELENGAKLLGQCEISHPVTPAASSDSELLQQAKEDGYEPLHSRICRLYYINGYGHEVYPKPNPQFIKNLSTSEVLVYSCGSLWTSIIPCLALRGVASAIAGSRLLRVKVLLLNGKNDRETDGYNAVDYIRAIASVLNPQHPPNGLGNAPTYPISAFITHLVYLKGTKVEVDVEAITTLGVKCILVGKTSERVLDPGVPQYDAPLVRQAMEEILLGQ